MKQTSSPTHNRHKDLGEHKDQEDHHKEVDHHKNKVDSHKEVDLHKDLHKEEDHHDPEALEDEDVTQSPEFAVGFARLVEELWKEGSITQKEAKVFVISIFLPARLCALIQ